MIHKVSDMQRVSNFCGASVTVNDAFQWKDVTCSTCLSMKPNYRPKRHKRNIPNDAVIHLKPRQKNETLCGEPTNKEIDSNVWRLVNCKKCIELRPTPYQRSPLPSEVKGMNAPPTHFKHARSDDVICNNQKPSDTTHNHWRFVTCRQCLDLKPGPYQQKKLQPNYQNPCKGETRAPYKTKKELKK